ncbi:hypothetical protein, partial [Halomonas sp. BM-2019]|uniref:hypothetical protein n=1 Tax=Halomonas sp. BM-2019 TaxID=2811227 RepID=UPI001B3C1E6B
MGIFPGEVIGELTKPRGCHTRVGWCYLGRRLTLGPPYRCQESSMSIAAVLIIKNEQDHLRA